jgi:PilZ domain
MDAPIAIVIVNAAHTVTLRKRLRTDSGIAVFSDTESLQALEAILSRPPRIVTLDLTFAATSRGAAMVTRLKTEPSLSGIELRLLIEDETNVPLILSQAVTSPEQALWQTSRPLDRAGTRQAVRFPMDRRAVMVNGEHGHLVDLSVTGAQMLVPMRLSPSQSVRCVMLFDESTEIRCQGTVAWSVAVPSGAAVQYRAGVQFINPDSTRLSACCVQYRRPSNPSFETT